MSKTADNKIFADNKILIKLLSEKKKYQALVHFTHAPIVTSSILIDISYKKLNRVSLIETCFLFCYLI